mmetsp:Transcript_27826/g.86024  ORF Transcript_27826/g.86024 Transcript_27826/m.86024 type:complete len:295 (+) Transcript_27826:137-1021(+)
MRQFWPRARRAAAARGPSRRRRVGAERSAAPRRRRRGQKQPRVGGCLDAQRRPAARRGRRGLGCCPAREVVQRGPVRRRGHELAAAIPAVLLGEHPVRDDAGHVAKTRADLGVLQPVADERLVRDGTEGLDGGEARGLHFPARLRRKLAPQDARGCRGLPPDAAEVAGDRAHRARGVFCRRLGPRVARRVDAADGLEDLHLLVRDADRGQVVGRQQRHEVHVAGVGRRDHGRPGDHVLEDVQPEALGPVQRDVAVDGGDERAELGVVEQAAHDLDVFVLAWGFGHRVGSDADGS